MINWRKSLGVIGAICVAGTVAFAQKPPGKSPYTFPKKIGAAELVNVEDFEPKTPGLGQVGQYSFQGWRLSIYVYDKQRTDIADTPTLAQIKPELDAAAGEILEAKRQGYYARADEGTAFAIPPMGTPPVFHCRSFILQPTAKPPVQAQPPYESYVCVTTAKKSFAKLRLSSTTPPGDQATVFTPVAASIELVGRMLLR
jgi:hypothetical protein